MDSGFRSPLFDFFHRGEVARDVRLMAAQGIFAPRAHEQLALLILLYNDPDQLISDTARETIKKLPEEPLRRFLARKDISSEMRSFFAARGIKPAEVVDVQSDDPILDLPEEIPDELAAHAETAEPKVLASLPVVQRMKIAMRGTREQRAQLVRDSNRLVSVAVLSSPKLTESEVEAFARMANLTEEVLRIIGSNRSWAKNYQVVSALARNPKTPMAMAMQFVHRLNEKDMKMLSIDRNVPEPIRLAARKQVVKNLK